MLYDVQIFYKVYSCLFRQIHGALFHSIGRVVQYIQVSGESEVLRVLWDEGEMHAFIFIHHHSIHQVEFIERDGSASDWTYETALQQADIIIIDIDIGKYIIEDSTQHITC